MNIEQQRAAFEAAIGRGKTYTERDFEMFRLGLVRRGRGEPVAPEGFRLIAVNETFDILMFWLDQCEQKGHLENCADLVEPWEKFEYRAVDAPQPANPTVKESLPVAEPVKVPSDATESIKQLEALMHRVSKAAIVVGYGGTVNGASAESNLENAEKRLMEHARALLARFGQPAQPVHTLGGSKEEYTRVFNMGRDSAQPAASAVPVEQDKRNAMTFDQFRANVEQWAAERGIYEHSTVQAQVLKTVSEMGELADATIKGDRGEFVDSVGDIFVCLVNAAYMRGVDMEECLHKAWAEIKDRRGHMVPGGAFVKE